VYLTARSYLLAGFTAASIVATIPFAPRSTVHMPDIHAADVQLAAAESKIAATVRTLRAVEARAVASAVEGASTTVLPAQRASTAATAVIVPVSVAGPVVGDVVALALDLAGTQAALMNSVSFVADASIAALTGATAEDLPPGFGVPQRLNVITADLSNLAGAINRLTGFLQSGAAATGAGTQTGVKTDSVAASNSGTGAAALLPLIGDVAILGVDMTAAPFAMTQTVTRALAAASTDLGAGDLQAAQTDFTTTLQAGLTESQARIAKDKNNIGAVLARLVGLPGTTTSQTGTANSVAGAASAVAVAKTTSTPALQSHPIDIGPRPVVTKPTSSTPAAEAVSADHRLGTVHESTTASTATSAPSTDSPQGASHTPGTTATPTRQRGNTTGTTKPATPSPTKADGQSPTKAGDSTSMAKHSAPAKPHKDGAKHRKH
jgi:hypothetical protein